MATRKSAMTFVIEEAPASNAGRPRLHDPALDAFAANWSQVPVTDKGKGIHVPLAINVPGLGNADKALVRHHLKVTLAENGVDKDCYETFTGKDGAIKIRRIS